MYLRLCMYVLNGPNALKGLGQPQAVAQFHMSDQLELFLQISTLPGKFEQTREGESRLRGHSIEQVARPQRIPERGIRKARDDSTILTVDGFGEPLTYVQAGDFGYVYVESPAASVVIGSLAYIKAIRPKTPVVLYWYES